MRFITEIYQLIHSNSNLVNIKTLSENKNIGKFECSGTYSTEYKENKLNFDLRYELSHLEDTNSTETKVYARDFGRYFISSFFKAIGDEITEKSQHNIEEYLKERTPKMSAEVLACFNGSLASTQSQANYLAFDMARIKTLDENCEKHIVDEKINDEKEEEKRTAQHEEFRVVECIRVKSENSEINLSTEQYEKLEKECKKSK